MLSLLLELVIVVGISVMAHMIVAYSLAPRKAKQGILKAIVGDDLFKTQLMDSLFGELTRKREFKDAQSGNKAESVHPNKFIYNMQIYRGFLNDLFSGKFYEKFEAIQKIEEGQQQILKKHQELSLEQTQRSDESISQVIEMVQKMAVQFYSSLNDLKTAIVSNWRP